MVNLVEDWELIEEYAEQKSGFYQITANDGVFEIRVQAGTVGFIREFQKREDPLLDKILDFCRKKAFIKVSRHVWTENFFK